MSSIDVKSMIGKYTKSSERNESIDERVNKFSEKKSRVGKYNETV